MSQNVRRRNLRKKVLENQHAVYIFSLEEMDHVIQKVAKTDRQRETWNKHKKKLETTASYTSAGKDALLMSKLLGDLGYAGSSAYIKYYGGKPHIILKGYPGLRKILNATRYGVQNAKVVSMGLGKYGGVNAAKSGGILTIFLLTGYRVIDYFVRDDATLSQLIGSLATDVVKVGIATGASIAAATIASGAGATMVASSSAAMAFMGGVTIAIGPLAAVIIVGIGVSYGLSVLDKRYKITDRLIAALDEIEEKGIQGVIDDRKNNLIKKGEQVVNDTIDSVIDYAIEKTQVIVISYINNFLRKMSVPKL